MTTDHDTPERGTGRLPRLDAEEALALCFSLTLSQALFLACGVAGAIALAGLASGDWPAAVLGGWLQGVEASVRALPTVVTIGAGCALALVLFALSWNSEKRALSSKEGRASVMRNRQSINGEMPRVPLLALVVLMTLTGIAEELLFRYVIFGLAQQLLTPLLPGFVAAGIGLVVSSVAFFLAHGGRPELATSGTFLLGVAFGIAYLATGSLAVVALAHALYNLLVLMTRRRQMRRDPDYFGGPAPQRIVMDEPDEDTKPRYNPRHHRRRTKELS